MHRYLVPAALSLVLVWTLTAATPQDPIRGKQANVYSDWPVNWVGQTFDLAADYTVAHAKKGGAFVLVMVAADFARFESSELSVCVPFSVLRLVSSMDGK